MEAGKHVATLPGLGRLLWADSEFFPGGCLNTQQGEPVYGDGAPARWLEALARKSGPVTLVKTPDGWSFGMRLRGKSPRTALVTFRSGEHFQVEVQDVAEVAQGIRVFELCDEDFYRWPKRGVLQGVLVGNGVSLDLSYEMTSPDAVQGSLLANGRPVRTWGSQLSWWERLLAAAGLAQPGGSSRAQEKVIDLLYFAYRRGGPRSLRANGGTWEVKFSYCGVADGTYHVRYHPKGNFLEIHDEIEATCWDQ